LFEICRQIHQGEWPDDFMESIIILIEKKSGAKESCVDFRTISLVTHASKIVLKMMQHRLEPKAEAFLENDQCGFRRGCGT